MGRGRQKAKHTKVARDLKYFSPDTNYTQLQRELGGGGGGASDPRLAEDLEKWPEYSAGDPSDEFDVDEDEDEEEDAKSA
jgi:hypothetical protein